MRKMFWLFTVTLMMMATNVFGSTEDVQTNIRACNESYEWDETIDIGWPLVIDCMEAIFLLDNIQDDEEDNNGLVECIYVDVDNDVVLMKQEVVYQDVLAGIVTSKYVNPSMDNKAAVNYQVIAQMKETTEVCTSYNIRIHLVPFHPQTCQQSLLNGERRIEVIGRYQNTKYLDCQVPEAENLSVHVNSSEEVEMKWYKNCTIYPPNTFSIPNQLKLHVQNIEFEHAGIYTCAMTYNGMTKYIVHYQMCVTHGQQGMKPETLCPNSVQVADIGENIVIEIDIVAGMGTVNDYDYTGHWNKIESSKHNTSVRTKSLCFFSKVASKENSTESQRIQCELKQSSEEQKCFLRVAEVEERIKVKNSFISLLHIRNVQQKDYGNYSFMMTVMGHERSTLCYVTLVPPRHKSPTSIIISVILVIIITLVSTLIINYFQIYIKVYMKRKFTKTHKDSCQVFLSYRYSSAMDETTRNMVKNSVQSIEAILLKLRCKVFDENRDGSISGYQSNSIQNIITSSDRVVVILASPDYIEDNWSVFKFQRCFEKTIETKSKLILVLGPGMKKYIKESSKFNETCFLVRRVMNISHVIEWSEAKKSSRRLSFEIEYAIPKIRKNEDRRDEDDEMKNAQDELINTDFV